MEAADPRKLQLGRERIVVEERAFTLSAHWEAQQLAKRRATRFQLANNVYSGAIIQNETGRT